MSRKGIVSIVVPIYKVENYIHRCINSILQQTYEQIEVILVDDGSPDHCGVIIDEYQEVDKRVHVIHKENGGLSDARNHGIKQATGEYIMFVDSDDWLDVDMVEKMVACSVEYQADIVQSAFYYAYDNTLLIDDRYFKIGKPPEILRDKGLMYELIINEKVKNFAWGKLYKTRIIHDIPFPKGVLFEDVFWAHQVLHQTNNFLLMHQPFYYYYQRDDSIVANYSPKNLDFLKGLKERHVFIQAFYEELIFESYRQMLKASLIHYNLLLLNKSKDVDKKHRKRIEDYIQQNYQAFKVAVKHDKYLRRQLYLFSLHPYFNVGFLGVRKGLMKVGLLPRPDGLRQVKDNRMLEGMH